MSTTAKSIVVEDDTSTGAFSVAAQRLADDILNETTLAASHHDTVWLREIVRAASDALTVIAGARLVAENTLFAEREAART